MQPHDPSLSGYLNSEGQVYVVFSYIDPAGRLQFKSFFAYPVAGETREELMLDVEEYAYDLATEYDHRPSLNTLEIVPQMPVV